MISDSWPNDLGLIVLLLLIVFGYWRGRGHAPAWSNVPLLALVTVSVGPSLFAVLLYLVYKSGLAQPPERGYRFGSFVTSLPAEFALLNWAFVPLYVVGRIWPRAAWARPAMRFAVVAMSVPNLMLFALAPEMISNARDAGQGIGIVEAMLLLSPLYLVLPAPDPGSSHFLLLTALTGVLPTLGLVAWSCGWLVGRQAGTPG